jgi:hypothetical protein
MSLTPDVADGNHNEFLGFRSGVPESFFILGCDTELLGNRFSYPTIRLSRNVGDRLPTDAAPYPKIVETSISETLAVSSISHDWLVVSHTGLKSCTYCRKLLRLHSKNTTFSQRPRLCIFLTLTYRIPSNSCKFLDTCYDDPVIFFKQNPRNVNFEIIRAVSMNIAALWNVTLCTYVHIRKFRSKCTASIIRAWN